MSQEINHRDIGNELKLFMFHEYSPGSCFFLPHGAKLYNNLISFLRYCYDKLEYKEVITPVLFNKKLWETSGHWAKYKENMFIVPHHHHCQHDNENANNEQNVEHPDNENEDVYSLKPMNCPSHCLMMKQMLQSYNDLPIRLADFGVLHRNELSGALSGLTRVRKFQQDDAHIFCTLDQVDSEIKNFLLFLKKIYDHFGMGFRAVLSTRPDDYIGTLEMWDKAEEILRKQIEVFPGWEIDEKGGAFYGAKISVMVLDNLGREHQCGTIQLDYNLPERFDIKYMAADGTYQRPVMLHRAILGSVERFMAILLEHTSGHLPFWLSPRQICIIPVSQKFVDYANLVKKTFEKFSIDVDTSDEKIGKKIRNAEVLKYNYIFVVGQNEESANTVNIRKGNEILGMKTINEAFDMCENEYKEKFIYG
jgi:threonyl-tRNA synthetase